MTEEDVKFLEAEKALCLKNLQSIKPMLDDLTQRRNECSRLYLKWKERYEKADMELALETKLTIIKKGGKPEVDNLEVVLRDKNKVKKLISLLREEEMHEAAQMTPNVPFTTT